MRRRLPSILLAAGVLSGLLGAPAMAQPANPKPRAGAAKAPPPVSGSVGSAKEEEAALPEAAPEPPASDADRALLRAILFAFQPAPTEIRVIAIEDVALLGDSRALNVLAELILDPRPDIQLAAIRAIRAFQTPRAEEILENVIRHPRMSDRLKQLAVASLPFQRSATAREFLATVSQDREEHYTAPVRAAAKTALEQSGDGSPPSPASPTPTLPPATPPPSP